MELSGHDEVLHIFLLGGFRLSLGSRTIQEDAWPRRKARSLIKLLALAPAHRLLREQIIDQLWPDQTLEAGANNLNQTLYHARRVLDPSRSSVFLRLQGESLILAPDQTLWIDAEAFEAAAAAGQRSQDSARYQDALELYRGDLLPEDRYEDWATTYREHLRRIYHGVLLDLAHLQQTRGALLLAIKALERLVVSDPLAEPVQRELMRLYARSNLRYQALRQYQQLRDALQRDLEVEPELETVQLSQEILSGNYPVEETSQSKDFFAAPMPQAAQVSPPTPLVGIPEGSEGKAAAARAEEPLTNLPNQLTSFIGRQQEVEEIRRLLMTTRLLTLVGPGGCGKTRLAQAAALEVMALFPDGVWLVELAALSDPQLVPQAAAAALGVQEEAGHPILETLSAYLCGKQMLLVLDNCEHLVEATAHLSQVILAACPQVTLLVTSRHSLGVTREQPWRVPSLSLPDPEHLPPFEMLPTYDAVQLFLERAAASSPGFRLTAQNAPALLQICQRLDGIPLALELAAVRVRVASVEQIAARLDDCFTVLGVGNRAALPRQQTLRATMDWSHALLSEQEQVVFRRLAAFAGSWTLEAAEAICAGKIVKARDVLALLAELADKSLLLVERQGEQVRYRLLEIIRQYSTEQLQASGEEAAIRQGHGEWYARLAEEAEPAITGPQQEEWLNRLELEHDNLRMALRTALETHEAERGVRLGGAMWRFWQKRGHLSEGIRWLEAVLAKSETLPEAARPARAKALNGAGVLTLLIGDTARCITLHEQALALRRELGDTSGIASSLNNLAMVAHYQGNAARAIALYQEALRCYRELGEQRGTAVVLNNLGSLLKDRGEYAEAIRLTEESLALFRDLYDPYNVAGLLSNLGQLALIQREYARATTLLEEALAGLRAMKDKASSVEPLQNLGMAAQRQGQYARAMALFEEGMAISQEVGDKWSVALGLHSMSLCLYGQGDVAHAEALCREGLKIHQELAYKQGIAANLVMLGKIAQAQGQYLQARAFYEKSLTLCQEAEDRPGLAACLEGVAALAALQGEAARAVRIFGAIERFREAGDAMLPPYDPAEYQRLLAITRSAIEDRSWQAAWYAGQTLSLEDALSEVLPGESPATTDAAGAPGSVKRERVVPLSRREREIVALIAASRTNHQIAQELGIAERTAETHVSNILSKLKLSSRAQVASWAAQQELAEQPGGA